MDEEGELISVDSEREFADILEHLSLCGLLLSHKKRFKKKKQNSHRNFAKSIKLINIQLHKCLVSSTIFESFFSRGFIYILKKNLSNFSSTNLLFSTIKENRRSLLIR